MSLSESSQNLCRYLSDHAIVEPGDIHAGHCPATESGLPRSRLPHTHCFHNQHASHYRYQVRPDSLSHSASVDVVRNARLEENLQSAEVSVESLRSHLSSVFDSARESNPYILVTWPAIMRLMFGRGDTTRESSTQNSGYIDLQPNATGRMRLPNNAYDALRSYTQTLRDQNTSPSEILFIQLDLLHKIPVFREEVERLRSENGSPQPELSEDVQNRLLRMPATGLCIPGQTASSPPVAAPSTPSRPRPSPSAGPPDQNEATVRTTTPVLPDRQEAQRAEYVKMQKEQEQKQREERERIKAQIKADREERRRRENTRKHGDVDTASDAAKPTSPQARNAEVRIQVRTFDGSTIRHTFPTSATLSKDVRPWIESSSDAHTPYNLKLILTPLPTRTIETAEEEQELSELGIKGSCTFVMAPVKGYVESYTGSTSNSLIGSAVSGGYNLLTGTAGALFGGVKSILGYGQPQGHDQNPAAANPPPPSRPVNIRTLADQRAEDAKKDQQFYNGNQLNFEPNKDDDSRKDD